MKLFHYVLKHYEKLHLNYQGQELKSGIAVAIPFFIGPTMKVVEEGYIIYLELIECNNLVNI